MIIFHKFIFYFSKILSEKEDELIMSILPSQLREIQEILVKETDNNATVELITLNQQNTIDQLLK